MGSVIVFLFLWVAAVLLETSLFTIIPWFKPNLFFLFSCLLCLRWRGFETQILAALFGLTADCFSTIPFGIYGFSFFLISFFVRWYAGKVYQGTNPFLVVVVSIAALINNLLVFFLLRLFFAEGDMTFRWLLNLTLAEIIPTAILTIPSLHLLFIMESRNRVVLPMRKF